MELSKVLNKVQKLVAVAEHPNTPCEEADAARAQADALMLKYAIDEATLNASRPAAFRTQPIVIEVAVGGGGDITGYVSSMLYMVALHTRTRVRNYTRWNKEDHVWMANVYGFESDVRYFELLYTTLRLHMLGVLRPKVSPTESLEENAYRLHEAGYNWLEIAELYGWKKVNLADKFWDYVRRFREEHPEAAGMKVPYIRDNEVQPATKVGSAIKRAYYREVERRGEKPTQIAAGGSETYRRSAAQGYTSRLNQRLRRLEGEQDKTAGEAGAVVLKSQADLLFDFYKEQNPDLFQPSEPIPEPDKNKKPPRERKYVPPPFSEAGYRAGARHADTADITGSNKAGSGRKRELG